MKVVDLFCGAGGLHLGFQEAGFEIKLAVDSNPIVAKTHEFNFPEIPFFSDDINQLTGFELFNLIEGEEIDVLIGGPPCQGFSTIGKRVSSNFERRTAEDERNKLILEYIRILNQLKPKYFVIENVKGLLTMDKGDFIKGVYKELDKTGYDYKLKLLNMADYGVPQLRERVFIIGNRLGHEVNFPLPTHSENGEDGTFSWENCWYAIQDLVEIKEDKDFNHVPLKHTEKIIERYKLIPEGGRLPENDLPPELYRKNFGNTYKRLSRFKPALTMVPGNDAFPIHPILNRSLTVREAARIQTFPDWMIFKGNRRQQGHQVGNAVPPLFSRILAEHIKKKLLKEEV
ncbi:DNA cytosine methyltransferase [Lysinibacillus fusiformis]|uniref:Cytosine-specific methyltransferase n=1 Tax=Lysinibacillus fusiformis TaxID=28031 RepID=E5LGB3_9BACI|nr:DNA cytosine methyltransferase [Lysinibacillus fusiformis]ADQ20501.1 M2.BfuAI [Lysinibacillus fusiformis]QSB10846.1 DNA cytosine methyltransferase [Lysinibacillus fusiformis]